MTKPKDTRERAARALCRKDGHPENIAFKGKPMWMSYLDVVDIVLAEVGGGSVPQPTQKAPADVIQTGKITADGHISAPAWHTPLAVENIADVPPTLFQMVRVKKPR